MKRKKKSYAKYGYLFCAPFVIAWLIFSLYPTIFTVLLSLTDFKGLGKVVFNFLDNPLQNFETILKNPSFKTAFKNTVVMWVLNFIPQISLALLLAAWFTDARYKIKGAGFFKVIFYMPNIITAATIAILFNKFFGYPMGPVNDIFTTLGWAEKPIQFLQDKTVAKGVVIFVQFWMWYGNTMIVLIAGILGINPSLYEAAMVDGASSRQQFFKITVPLLKPILQFTMVTSAIGGLQMYDIPQLFNEGSPVLNIAGANVQSTRTIVMLIKSYINAGAGQNYGRAAAYSVVLFIITLVVSMVFYKLTSEKN
jgi:multiple sugar transport system permease protein